MTDWPFYKLALQEKQLHHKYFRGAQRLIRQFHFLMLPSLNSDALSIILASADLKIKDRGFSSPLLTLNS